MSAASISRRNNRQRAINQRILELKNQERKLRAKLANINKFLTSRKNNKAREKELLARRNALLASLAEINYKAKEKELLARRNALLATLAEINSKARANAQLRELVNALKENIRHAARSPTSPSRRA